MHADHAKMMLMSVSYLCAVQSLTPNDAVVWQIPSDVKSGQLPTYLIVHLFR